MRVETHGVCEKCNWDVDGGNYATITRPADSTENADNNPFGDASTIMNAVVTTEQFDEILSKKSLSRDLNERTRRIFVSYGSPLSWDVLNVVLHAIDLEKLPEVLDVLETHFKDHLAYQHPTVRGKVTGATGNQTQAMFLSICRDTLKLASNTQAGS